VLESVEDRLLIEAEEQREPEQRHHRDELAGSDVGRGAVLVVGLTGDARCTAHSRYTAARITPVDATTTYHRLVRNAPSSDRNSPTKPEKPGSPIDANVAGYEQTAEDRRRLPDPAEIGSAARRCAGGS